MHMWSTGFAKGGNFVMRYDGQSKIKQLKEELNNAKLELQIAEQNFNNAEPEFIDIAVFEVTSARLKYDALIKQYKKAVLLNALNTHQKTKSI